MCRREWSCPNVDNPLHFPFETDVLPSSLGSFPFRGFGYAETMKSLSKSLSFAVLSAWSLLVGCGDTSGVVWPISGETTTDYPLSSTFGPRIHTDDLVYDFHRGIDVAVPTGTDIHAIAKGTVVQIQANTSAGGMLVQVEHDGYFSNYIHASEVTAEVGDNVDPGDVIAKSGAATNGFQHLHLEIRKPAEGKKDCVHPLDVLPYPDNGAPTLEVTTIDTTTPTAPQVTVTVTIPAGELDLKKVAVATYEGDPAADLDGLMPLSEQAYDVEDWNRTFTVNDSDAMVDNPDLEGISVRPEKFNNTMSAWKVAFTFKKLTGPTSADRLRVRATVLDVRENVRQVDAP